MVDISDALSLEDISCAVISFDRQWHYRYINQRAEKFLGKTREELSGQSVLDVFPEFKLTLSYRLGQQAMQEHTILEYEEYIAYRLVWTLVHLYPTHDGLLFFVQDITQHKQIIDPLQESLDLEAESIVHASGAAIEDTVQVDFRVVERLQKYRERLQLVQQAANIGIFEWNIQTGKVVWTREAEALYGLKPGEFPGHVSNWEKYLHPDDRAASNEKLYEAVAQKQHLDMQFRVVWPDKSVHWIYAKGHIFYDPQEKPLRMVGINIDITERKQYEEDLKRTETNLRLFAESDVIGFAFDDSSGGVTYANDTFLQLIGYSRSDLEEGKINWINMTPPEWRSIDEEKAIEAQQKGTATLYEKQYIRKDGSRVDVLIGYMLIGSHKERSVAFILDITKRKSLERQKDEFISIASHELRTPVTSLKVFTQVLQNRFKNSGDLQNAALLAKMGSQVTKLTKLIDDLLDVTKVEAGALQLHETDFALLPLIDEIVEEVQRTTEHNIVVRETGIQQDIRGDRDRIGQVIANLLSNAIKYSPQTDTIFVNVSSNGGQVTVSVQDFGMGIPQDKQGSIFQRFYRVDEKNRETISGMGLGLYISAEIIKRHGGTMTFESKVGYGSTFSFCIPIQRKGSYESNVVQIEEAAYEQE